MDHKVSLLLLNYLLALIGGFILYTTQSISIGITGYQWTFTMSSACTTKELTFYELERKQNDTNTIFR